MKFLLALLPFGFLNATTAWTVLGSRQNQIHNSNSKLMASRSADKALSRQAWAEKKGISDETEDSSTSFCTVVGGGRIGSLLAQGDDTLLFLSENGSRSTK